MGTHQPSPPPDGSSPDLEQAVGDLLARVPETWTAFDADQLTALQQQALSLLTAAGMVDRKASIRARMCTHPLAFEATFTATGERGVAEALGPLVAAMWSEWQDSYRKWIAGEARETPPFHCERGGFEEWRLTDQGVLAQADLKADPSDRDGAFDWVLKRGLFDGKLRLLPDGRLFQHQGVPGKGVLVAMRKVQAEGNSGGPAGIPGVNIANWPEGAQAIAAAFAKLVAAQQASTSPPAATKPPGPAVGADVDEDDDATGGPVQDPHDDRKAVWAGKRIYLGNDTEVSRLFWLLARPVGRAANLAEVQRAIDRMETPREGQADEVRKAAQRVRKVISKLRAALREAGLDDHVLIVKDGPQPEPQYSMVPRFGK